MDIVTRFGKGTRLYTFNPALQVSIRDNFRDLVPMTNRLPGLSGGYDELGARPAPASIGNVSLTMWVIGQTWDAVRIELDKIAAMADWGVQRLYKQSQTQMTWNSFNWGTGLWAPELRWCEARLNNIDFSQNARNLPHVRQRVTINFQVPSAEWRSIGTESVAWGYFDWGDGTNWGGLPIVQPVTGLSNDFFVNYTGNVTTYPRIQFATGTGQSATNFKLQRIESGIVVDEVSYTGTLAPNKLLEIDTRRRAVTIDAADAYTTAFDYQDAGWMRLVNGTNQLRVTLASPSDAGTIRLRYYEAYR